MLELKDGGFIALDWLVHKEDNSWDDDRKRNIICLIPGINGHSDNRYVVSMQQACFDNKYDLVVINWRGMSGVPLSSPDIYVGWDLRHIEEAVDYIFINYCLD